MLTERPSHGKKTCVSHPDSVAKEHKPAVRRAAAGTHVERDLWRTVSPLRAGRVSSGSAAGQHRRRLAHCACASVQHVSVAQSQLPDSPRQVHQLVVPPASAHAVSA